MKKALLFLLKTGLFVFFIYNLGIISFIANMENPPSAPLKENFKEEDLDWLNGKYENALKLGAQYSPELYFSDLAEIELRKKNNDFDHRALPTVTNTVTNLAYLFHKNLDNLRFKNRNNKDEVISYMNRISLASDSYKEIINPGAREEQKQGALKMKTLNYWLNLLTTFLLWILNQYLKNFLPALLLLWIWWYQEKETWKIKNPLSFLFCLIIYPVIIIRTWKEKINERTRYLIMTINYRQRQLNLFSLFSENEISEIKKFAKSNISLKKYRQKLSDNGLIVRHSFAPALLISLVFLVLSEQNSLAQNISSTFSDENKIEQRENAPPNLSLENCIEFEKFDLIYNQGLYSALLISKTSKFADEPEKCLDGFNEGVKHVPILIFNN